MDLDAWLQVAVSPGMFESERAVRFANNAGSLSLVVDRGHVRGSRLRVSVLWLGFEKALVSLPRQPFNGSRRVLVDAAELVFSRENPEGEDDSMRS
jgi:hypothetical protein